MSLNHVLGIIACTLGISAFLQVGVAGRQTILPSSLFPAVRLSKAELRELYRGEITVKVLDSDAPSDLVVFAGSRINVTPQRFVDAIRHSARLWEGSKIPKTGTFHVPVRTADVTDMRLPAEDLDALRRCRPGDCDVKLSAEEIARLRVAVEGSPGDWRSAAQTEFRLLILDRIHTYRRAGLSGLALVHDQEPPIDPYTAFTNLLSRAQFENESVLRLAEYLARYPRLPVPREAEDHLYWLETVHPPKPTIQASHIVIDRGTDEQSVEVAVVSRQVFATHYINASLSVTLLVKAHTGERFMLYVNRSSADGLGGLFSGVKRYFVQRRVRRGARDAFEHLKQRIERYSVQH
jgi:hypothetical protein